MKRLLVLLLFMLPFFAVAQTKKGIRTTSVETDTLYVKKLSNYDLSKMLVVDTTTGKVYMRTYTPYTNTSYCVEIIDTVYYNCDTIEVAEDTLWLSGDNDPQDLGYIIIPAHDSIYCENYVVNIDTVCYPFPYSYSPWTRSWTNETVFLNHLNDDVGVGTHLPTVQFETTKDLAVGRGVYFKGGSGDVDLDGDVDGADITKLRRYLVGLSSTSNPAIKWTYPELVAMDVNGNGTIGEDDYDAMLMTIATGALYYSDPRTYYDSSKRVQGKSLYRMISGSTILGDKYATFSVFPSTIDKYTVEVNGSIRVPYNDSLVFGGYKTAAATQTIITVNKSRENLLTVTGSLEVAGTDTLFANNEIYAIGMTASTTATNLVSKLSSGQLVTVPYITSLGGSVTSVVVVAGTGISVAGSVVTQTGVFTVTNTAPDQPVVITGAGISTVASSYPTFTITTTEVDGSTTNELQSLSITGTSTPTVSLSIGGGDFTLIGDGSTSLSTSNDTITINTPVVDSILPQGLNSVMGIDSTTQHRYNAWIAGGTTGIVMTLAHEDFTPRIRMIHNDWGAKADTGLMQIDGGGCNSYWDGTYEKLFWNSLDSFPNYELALKKVIIKGSASQDWTRTANGTYLSFYTTANDSLTAREAMRITQDKKVAIGTTSPTAQLTVAKNVHLDAPGRSMAFDSVYVKDLSTGDLKTTHKSSMGLLDSDSTAWIHNSTRGVTYLRNDGDSVGIGTKIPDRLLEVDGTAKVKDSIWIGENYWLTTDEGGIITNENFQSKTLSVIQNGGSREIAMFGNDVISNDSVSVFTAKSNLVLGGNEEKNYRLYINGDEKVINKIYAPGITTAASEDSIIAWKASTGEFIAVPKSVFPTDTSAFVHTPSGITHLRNINDVVSIGTTSTNDINRKLHAEGSASIRDTVYIGGVSYIAPYSDDVALITNGDFRVEGLMKSKSMNVSELTNDGTPDSVVTVKNGNFYASALSSVNLYRYSAYSSGSTKVEVLASGVGITAAFSAPTQLDFTIPSGVRIVSAKINITGISTLTIDMSTTDMVNSSLLDRWMPIVQVWREDTGAEQTGVTTTLITSTHDQFRISGLNNSAGMHIRLSF